MSTGKDSRTYATRTVLFDRDGRVAVINVRKYDYYKIPGGGVEDGEELLSAARREVSEEAGCDCEIVANLGRITTDVADWRMRDVSDGFIAKVVGEKRTPQFDAQERARDFQLEWRDNLTVAIRDIEAHAVADPATAAIQARDLAFLKRAEKYLSQ